MLCIPQHTYHSIVSTATYSGNWFLPNWWISLIQGLDGTANKLSSSSSDLQSNCHKPKPKPWTDGVVTQLFPVIQKNCSKLFKGDLKEVQHVRDALKYWESITDASQLLEKLSNCSQVRQEFLNNFYTSRVEETFPIAYILVVHTNPQQIIRFLKAVYRPQNLYCIHPDPKSGSEFALYFYLLSNCLKNIFIASRLSEVHYSDDGTINAQINCYIDLLHHQVMWHYVINLCGRELPLRTNREIVDTLTLLNGASIIEPREISAKTRKTRFMTKLEPKRKKFCGHKSHVETTLGPPPHGIKLYKSFAYNALSREFVTFLFNDKTSLDFLRWIRDASVPEDICRAPAGALQISVYMLPQAPHGAQNTSVGYKNVAAVIWLIDNNGAHCAGKDVHHVCVITSSDLPQVQARTTNRGYLFFNKYFMEDDHIVMDCMEERLIENNKKEYADDCT